MDRVPERRQAARRLLVGRWLVVSSRGAHRLPRLPGRHRILGLHEYIANDPGPTVRELCVVLQSISDARVAATARAVGELLVERGTLFEGAERRPERGVERFRLSREQCVRGPGV